MLVSKTVLNRLWMYFKIVVVCLFCSSEVQKCHVRDTFRLSPPLHMPLSVHSWEQFHNRNATLLDYVVIVTQSTQCCYLVQMAPFPLKQQILLPIKSSILQLTFLVPNSVTLSLSLKAPNLFASSFTQLLILPFPRLMPPSLFNRVNSFSSMISRHL